MRVLIISLLSANREHQRKVSSMH
eukprot:COSAG06_NODE_14775_length_1127_cov_1.150778_2_plen_23_part_01